MMKRNRKMKSTVKISAIVTIIVLAAFFMQTKFIPFPTLQSNRLNEYREASNGKFKNKNSNEIITIFGNPDLKLRDEDMVIWAYNPKEEDLKNAKSGEVIGLNFYIDEHGVVVDCKAMTMSERR